MEAKRKLTLTKENEKPMKIEIELWIQIMIFLKLSCEDKEQDCHGNMEILKVCVLYKLNSVFWLTVFEYV